MKLKALGENYVWDIVEKYYMESKGSKEEDFLTQAQREILKDSRKRDKKTAFPIYQH
ncbi:hypothetical protein MTR_7g032870 [Medicago truncatula]|uniref:Uncharacterized protein n=1 Tax=Medicago truncatula TaxID=3880 RepID=G7L5G8_MEDTR|nr:hypothetical protein MTR_7g032870 [Medicago truncatula]